ncbi:small acid-soluble spore protein [Clostridia bacterium]|nr:small acid-soluble spore protein [Clostridia bacterium]
MMANNSSLVVEARNGLDRFKYEVANEVGVTLKQGYNGDITSRDAGRIGGNMVKKMIQSYEQNLVGRF